MRKLLLLLSIFIYSPNISAASEITLQDHPRLLLFKGEETFLKNNISKDSNLRIVHSTILEQSDISITKPVLERKLTGKRLLSVSRDALKRIFFLSYSYRMTGEKRYLDRAEKEMLAIADFSDWHPEHFLDVAEMTTAMSIGYDWLYPALSEKSRKIIRTAIIDMGLKPSLEKKYKSWLRVTHNWNQVCNAGMALGALAVYEDNAPLSEDILKRSAESIQLPMSEYNPDGTYPEGYSYWNYGTTYNVLYLSVIKKALGRESIPAATPGFLKTGEYLLHMTGPSGKPFNYSDAGTNGISNPAMFWFASETNDSSLIFTEAKYLSNPKNIKNERFLPALLIWADKLNTSKISTPKKKLWVGQGSTPVALMRSSWNNDAVFAGIKGGTPSTNHSHMDIGSFVIDAGEIRWAMDFGMQEYNSLESKNIDLWNMKQNSPRWQVFRYNNKSHNTITLNGHTQKIKGNAVITESSSKNSAFIFAQTNLTSLYSDDCSSLKRGIAISDGKYVLIRDEIQTLAKKTLLRWSMATEASVTIKKDGSALLELKGKSMTMKAGGSSHITFTTWETDPKNGYDAVNPGTTIVGFECELAENEKYFFNVLLILGKDKYSGKDPGALSAWK
jgi:hypothetical protein